MVPIAPFTNRLSQALCLACQHAAWGIVSLALAMGFLYSLGIVTCSPALAAQFGHVSPWPDLIRIATGSALFAVVAEFGFRILRRYDDPTYRF